jgi:RND superfamily putative drug exporter
VLIFQEGRLQGPLDYTSFGGIIFWVPLMMFVFLFGISMDYHVFILSRVREIWARDSSPKQAIVGSVASIAGVVTSAALIMVALFSLFSTLPLSALAKHRRSDVTFCSGLANLQAAFARNKE